MTTVRSGTRPPEDLAGVPDAHLHSWMTVLDRRLILQRVLDGLKGSPCLS
jgi:hypothetical protein